MAEASDPEEADRMWFRDYTCTLQALASDPVAACHQMGNYNSPGEIWYELTACAYLPETPFVALTKEQLAAIAALAADLKTLPNEAMATDGTMPISHTACVAALGHPAWIPFREKAAILMESLATAIEANQKYLAEL